MKNQKGFASVTVLIFAFVGLIVAGVWMYLNNRVDDNCVKYANCVKVRKPDSTLDQNFQANWKTYRNEEYGFEFQYPEEFTVYQEWKYGWVVVRPEDKKVDEVVEKMEIDLIDNNKKLSALEWWNNEGPFTETDYKKMGLHPGIFPVQDNIIDGLDSIYIGGQEGYLSNYLIISRNEMIIKINCMMNIEVCTSFKFTK